MGETDWEAVGDEFRQRRLTTLTKSLHAHGVKDDADKALASVGNGSSATGEFKHAWTAASTRRGATAVLAAYLYARCQAEWELTGDYAKIRRTIAGARTGSDASARPAHAESAAVELFLQHVESLPDCMAAESAVNCSCPIALDKHAGNVATESAAIMRSISKLPGPVDDSFVRFLTEIVERHYLTYDAIAVVARAVLSWLMSGETALVELEACKALLEKAEGSDAIANDVYASELRAHRYALDGLVKHTPGPGRPDLRIRDGRIIYCYPFALPGRITWDKLEHEVWRRWENCKLPGTAKLAGETPHLLEKLSPSDIWDATKYQGVVLTLKPINVHTTADLDLRHSVEVRLNKFGNHYIRIEFDDFGPEFGLHDAYQGLRRAAHVMGDEDVTTIGSAWGESWLHLHEYAAQVLTDLYALVVDGLKLTDVRPGELTADFGNDFNVVVEVRQATVRAADGKPRDATAEDIVEIAGQLLLNPVVGYATALEEWTRRPVPDNVQNLSGDAGYETDLITRTDNTTLLVLPGSPNWVYLGQEEKTEFVASLKPLLQRWQHELEVTKNEVSGMLEPDHLDTLDRRQVEEGRLRLASHVADVRQCLDLLHSNALCRPAVHRRLVDRLYEAAGLLRQEAELESEIREVDALYERVAAHLGLIEEENTRKYQRNIQVILGGLATLSLAGFIDWIQKLISAAAAHQTSPALAAGEIAMVLVAAGLIAVAFQRMSRSGGKRVGHG